MTPYTVRVSVDPAYRRAIKATLLRRWARTVLEHLGLSPETSLEIAVTDDARVQELNRTYRGLDEATDVLAFPFLDRSASAPYYGDEPPSHETETFVVPVQTGNLLGEVVISFPYAQCQAMERGHPLQEELALLLVHGLLHLLGYDHQERADELRMWAETRRLLAVLGFSLTTPLAEEGQERQCEEPSPRSSRLEAPRTIPLS